MKSLMRSAPLLIALLCAAGFLGAVDVQAAPGPWWGEYYPNPDLQGGPAVSRQDTVIGFEWGLGSPDPALPADNFSVCWTREEWFEGGTYRFQIRTDDGFRLWINGELVAEEWRQRQDGWTFTDHYVSQGTHTVVIEYFEYTGAAVAQVGWEKIATGATWRGEYYDNRDLEGDPVLVRDDGAIDFYWGNGSPDDAVPADDFSVRWSRTLGFTAGRYRFLASCDDGVRITVDGALVVDAWQKQKLPNTNSGEITLAAGQHTVVVEYFEEGGEAAAHVWWGLEEPVSGWRGVYYDNPDMAGGPTLERNDPEIDFDWGTAPPVDWMPDGNFSVRWSRTVTFDPGYYIFKVQSDDGMRFWMDDALLIDKWRQMKPDLHYLDGVYLEGSHELVVEYFERNGSASIHFWWEASRADGVMPRVADPTVDPWLVEFFANPELEGKPTLSRIDEALDYDWGTDAPAPGLPTDGFSVRWTQMIAFEEGTYRFATATDDGVRLWVDDQLLIDAWQPMRSSHTTTISLIQGNHEVRMESFDRSGTAMARLTWERISHAASYPSSAPSGTPPAEETAQWGARRIEVGSRRWAR